MTASSGGDGATAGGSRVLVRRGDGIDGTLASNDDVCVCVMPQLDAATSAVSLTFLRVHVRYPQGAVVPPGPFPEAEPLYDGRRLHHPLPPAAKP